MRYANETYAYFTVHGDFDPADVTEKVGLKPTESWRKGDPTANGNHSRIFSRWSFDSGISKSEPLEAHVANLLMILDPHQEAIKEISKAFNGTLQLVGYFWCAYPGLHFDAQIAAAIGRYGLAVDFDFYGLYSHRREDTGYTYEPDH